WRRRMIGPCVTHAGISDCGGPYAVLASEMGVGESACADVMDLLAGVRSSPSLNPDSHPITRLAAAPLTPSTPPSRGRILWRSLFSSDTARAPNPAPLSRRHS